MGLRNVAQNLTRNQSFLCKRLRTLFRNLGLIHFFKEIQRCSCTWRVKDGMAQLVHQDDIASKPSGMVRVSKNTWPLHWMRANIEATTFNARFWDWILDD
jgi:hypothetical protein